MARQLKPMQVDTYKNQITRAAGLGAIPIMLNRNNMRFFAEVEAKEVSAGSVEDLKALLDKKLKDVRAVDWKKKIHLEIEEPDRHQRWGQRVDDELTAGRLVFSFERAEFAQSSTGVWLERKFTEDLDERDQKARESNPFHDSDSVGSWRLEALIDYSDEVWESLKAIAAATKKARERLSEILDPKDGGKKLLALGSSGFALLGAGEKASSK